MSGDLSVIRYMLQAPLEAPPRIATFHEWAPAWKQLVTEWKTPVARALAGGFAADRPAWAFAAGYQAAIQRLAPAFDSQRMAAVCITEGGGVHPARIRCRLTATASRSAPWRLDGMKSFVTGAEGAEILIVAASCGTRPAGRNALRVAAVPTDRRGITVSPLPALGMVPEIPHSAVEFAAIGLADQDLLPGDGYRTLVKPFRTLEDLHVTGALLAWIFGLGRRSGWPENVLENLLSLMVSVHSLALAPPLDFHVHLGLAGCLAQVRHFLEEVEPLWDRVDAAARRRWQRDRPILDIAESARQRRLAAARAHYRPA